MARAVRRKKAVAKLSHLQAPAGMELATWQRSLRRQAAIQQKMEITPPVEPHADPPFGDYRVHNPVSGRTHRVALRGDALGENYCTCPDFAVNTLGTCKHVEAVLRKVRRRYARVLRAGFRPPYAEVYVRYGDQRALRFSAGADCPAAVERAAAAYVDADGVLRPDKLSDFDGFVRAVAAAGHPLHVYDDALDMIAAQRDAVARCARLDAEYARPSARAWRQLLKLPLLPYQQEGALFAARAGRALIADEMGLGKTVQAIAAAELLARTTGIERVLVVCPTSLKSQWQQEIARFSGRPALIIEGGTGRRTDQCAQEGAFFKVTNYDVIHRDVAALNRWAPDLVVLDEAQRIKNWQTRAAHAVKQISSRYAIVLTGTPLENRLDELHSIVEFVDRHRLGPLFAFKATHEIREEGRARVVGYRQLDQLNRTLAPLMIRRTKAQVLSELPPRVDKNFFVPMTPPQWGPHNENREIVAKLVSKWRRHHFLTEADQLRLRIALQNMRMVCDNTYLLDRETRHGQKIAELEQLLGELLERPENKVVIFSQWVRMNELVAEMLAARRWDHVHLHGGVPGPQRKDLVHRLHTDDACRVFLSTDAGGVGLNLQTAATVINLDLPWNPAVLEQRIGRVHRMGQQRPVQVINLIAEHTIEHGMLALLGFKRSLFAGVLDGTAAEVCMGGGALNRFMKTVEAATDGVPANGHATAPLPVEAADENLNRVEPAAPKEASGTPAQHAAAAALPELLSRAGALLHGLARALQDDGATQGGWMRVVRGAAGERELRLKLPDDGRVENGLAQLLAILDQA